MNIPGIEYDWKALSIKQPAASLIIEGEKSIENRNPRQYKDATLRGKWIMIHASKTPRLSDQYTTSPGLNDRFPRGAIIGLARIEGVYTANNIQDPADRQWAHDEDACILFSDVIKLHVPVDAPGGLNTWTLKPPPTWSPPRVLSKKDATLSPDDLRDWRKQQEAKYRVQSLSKRVALINILLALQRREYVVTRTQTV